MFLATARDEPHLHIALQVNLLSAKVLKRLLAACMRELIGAPNVDVRPFCPERHTSYISKAPFLFNGCRRYWTSRGWRVARWGNETAFILLCVISTALAMVERMAIAAGHIITDRSPGRFKTLLPLAPP